MQYEEGYRFVYKAAWVMCYAKKIYFDSKALFHIMSQCRYSAVVVWLCCYISAFVVVPALFVVVFHKFNYLFGGCAPQFVLLLYNYGECFI